MVDEDVLKYLLGRSAKAYYMEKDIKLADSTISMQSHIITYKDSIISNHTVSLEICNSQNAICDMQLITANAEIKKANRKVKFFKFTTISVAILGSISSIYLLFH